MATPGPALKGEQRRLVIKEMVLENFKSYAGAITVGPFHKCFSSVVGPNGSGKSNVIDGLLFVFGRRAKQLRFNKVSELIHNSTNHRNLQQAKVSVHFVDIIDKEGEDFEVVPGSDLIVSRTATRQNASDYYINDRKVPVKEVTTLLKAKGIDLDNNRFLILQGEVEQISMMKPKGEEKGDTGLLEYLEDIIGTHHYIPLIEDAHKRLEELNEERQKAVVGVKTVERQVEALEGPRKQAEAFLGKQLERHQLTARTHLLSMHINQRKVEGREGQVEELKGKLAHEEGKVEHVGGALAEAEQQAKAAEKDLAKGSKALEKLRAAFSKHECRDSEAQENRKHLGQQADKLRTKITADTKKLQKLEKEVAEMEAGIPAKQEEAQQLTGELQAAQQVLDGMLEGIKGEVEGYRTDLSKVREELAPWEEQIVGVQSRIDLATAELDLLQRQQREAQAAHQAAVEGAATARQAAAAKREEIGGMQGRLQQLKRDMDGNRARLAEAQQQEEQCQAAMTQLRGSVEQLRQEASSQQTRGRAQQALLEAKANGTIPGLYGRLGDLGAVDAKYDVAVSTATGALDFIVVETEEDARRGVELLRQQGLGRLTFLIRQKQEHLRDEAARPVKTPQGSPRLFDLVKFQDQRLKVAFYYAFRNTLVAPDLPTASGIAYARDSHFKRVVTLQGQLIESSGTMTGGGSQPRRGAMCIGKAAPKTVDAAAAAAELKQLERQLQKAQQDLQAAQQAVAEAAAAVKEAEKGVQQLEVGLPKAAAEAEAQEARAADLEQRLQQLSAAAEAAGQDTAQQRAVEATVKKEQAALQKLERSAAGLRAEAQRLEKAMEDAGGPALKRQRDAVEKLHKGIAEATAAATKLGVQLKASGKQAEKLRKDLAKSEGELERLAAEREQLEKDMVEWEGEALEVLQQVKAQEAAVAELQAAVDTTRTQRDKHADDLKVMRGVAAKIKGQLAEVEQYITAKRRENEEHQAKLDDIAEKLAEYGGADMPMLTEEEAGQEEEALAVEIQSLKTRAGTLATELDAMSADLAAIEDYRQKEAEYQDRLASFRDVTAKRDETRKEYDAVRKKRLAEFMEGFNVISLRLKEVYQMITLGGDAELELVDSLDPFSEGIVFSVRPPKKSWKNISNLSGGEKTLSSLALVFALHYYKPTPLYVMDEIDAALDFKNVSIVGHFIKERTKDAQFVIISLRNNMFELADVLVGIYKTFNTTKTITINPSDFEVGAAAPTPLSTPGSALRSPIPA